MRRGGRLDLWSYRDGKGRGRWSCLEWMGGGVGIDMDDEVMTFDFPMWITCDSFAIPGS